MQKVSLRKLSILGLVLMAASAVTAAVLPASSSKDKDYTPGSLTVSTQNGSETPGLTCQLDTEGDNIASCNITTVTRTTGGAGGSSDGNGNSTANPNDVDS